MLVFSLLAFYAIIPVSDHGCFGSELMGRVELKSLEVGRRLRCVRCCRSSTYFGVTASERVRILARLVDCALAFTCFKYHHLYFY